MDLRSLECFVAVAEEGSVSRAAVRLHMSQPPLSVRLQSLERELGVELLVRHGRGVDLTAPGRLLLERARRLLADLDTTGSAVRAVGEGRRGRLALAVGRTVSPALLGRVLRDLRRSAEDLALELTELSDAEVLDRVAGGTADAALLHLGPEGARPRPAEPGRGHEVAVVDREPLVAVLRADHPQAGSERVDLADLVAGTLVAPDRRASPGLYEHAVAAWRRGSGAAPEVVQTESVVGVLALVSAGVGVALLPASADGLAWDALVTRPLRQHAPPVETAIAWLARDDAPVLRRLLRVALATPEPDVLGPGLVPGQR